jgi:hypothetical protein
VKRETGGVTYQSNAARIQRAADFRAIQSRLAQESQPIFGEELKLRALEAVSADLKPHIRM